VDLGSAPQRVLKTHSSDQIAHLFVNPWSATARARFPSPVRGEARSMPTHNSLGPDDGYGVKNTRTAIMHDSRQFVTCRRLWGLVMDRTASVARSELGWSVRLAEFSCRARSQWCCAHSSLGPLRIPEQDTHPEPEILARKAHVPDQRGLDSPHKTHSCIRPRSAFFEDVRI
jgi:hypothetical protein